MPFKKDLKHSGFQYIFFFIYCRIINVFAFIINFVFAILSLFFWDRGGYGVGYGQGVILNLRICNLSISAETLLAEQINL